MASQYAGCIMRSLRILVISLILGIGQVALTAHAAEVKVMAGDGVGWEFFGYSVSISGDTAIVGAYGDDDNGPASGSAYIYGPPTVSSITRADACPAAKAGTSVRFDVTFTEYVYNIDTSDFGLTGPASGTIAQVSSDQGTQVQMTVNTVTGSGGLRLDLLDDDSITSITTTLAIVVALVK